MRPTHILGLSKSRLRTGADIATRVELGDPRFVRHAISADLGQAGDYSAVIILETWTATERTYQQGKFEAVETMALKRSITSFRVVGAHLPRLGTSYPIIARQIAAFVEDLPDADLIVDGTGVGRGVVDILRGINLHPVSITITGGDNVNKVSNWDIRVPKTELVSALVASSQEGRLHIAPNLELRDVLTKELAAFSPRQTASGRTTYEGREGVHDDLALALMLGVWHQSQPRSQGVQLINNCGFFGR